MRKLILAMVVAVMLSLAVAGTALASHPPGPHEKASGLCHFSGGSGHVLANGQPAETVPGLHQGHKNGGNITVASCP